MNTDTKLVELVEVEEMGIITNHHDYKHKKMTMTFHGLEDLGGTCSQKTTGSFIVLVSLSPKPKNLCILLDHKSLIKKWYQDSNHQQSLPLHHI